MSDKGINVLRNVLPIPWITPWKTGRYYTTPLCNGSGTFTVTTSVIYTVPFYIPNSAGVTITSIGKELTTAGAGGSLARIGIYEFIESYNYGKLLYDPGNFATDGAPGFAGKTSLSKYLPQGWYLAAFCATGGTFRCFTGTFTNFARGSFTPISQNTDNWFPRFSMTAAEVTEIVTNGYQYKFTNDQVFETPNVPQRMKVLIGI